MSFCPCQSKRRLHLGLAPVSSAFGGFSLLRAATLTLSCLFFSSCGFLRARVGFSIPEDFLSPTPHSLTPLLGLQPPGQGNSLPVRWQA